MPNSTTVDTGYTKKGTLLSFYLSDSLRFVRLAVQWSIESDATLIEVLLYFWFLLVKWNPLSYISGRFLELTQSLPGVQLKGFTGWIHY